MMAPPSNCPAPPRPQHVQHGGALHHRLLLRTGAADHRCHPGRRPVQRGPRQLRRLQDQVPDHLGPGGAAAPVRPLRSPRCRPPAARGQPAAAERAGRPGRCHGGGVRADGRDRGRPVLEPVVHGPRAGDAGRPGRGRALLAQPLHAQLRGGAGRCGGAGRAAPRAAHGPLHRHRRSALRRLHVHVLRRVRRHRPLALPRVRRGRLARQDGPRRRRLHHLPGPHRCHPSGGAGALGRRQGQRQASKETERLKPPETHKISPSISLSLSLSLRTILFFVVV